MGAFVTLECDDFSSFLNAVEETVKQLPLHQLWWRGHTDASWELVPGVYRETKRGWGYEASIAVKFMQRAPARYDNCPPPNDAARWLFLAQHYRLRTRLLDWSESPLVALYFAVQEDQNQAKAAAVWALDPFELNRRSVVQMDSLIAPHTEHPDRLLRKAFERGSASEETVIALITEEVDLRLTVQQSGITVHGSKSPVEKRADADKLVLKITVAPDSKPYIRRALSVFGVRERSLFPDLEHLAFDLNSDIYPEIGPSQSLPLPRP